MLKNEVGLNFYFEQQVGLEFVSGFMVKMGLCLIVANVIDGGR